MELRNRETGAVVTDRQFRDSFPNTSFPNVLTTELFNEYGYDPILEGPQAVTTPPYEISQRDGIEEVNGQWFTKYVVGPTFDTPEDEVEYRQRIDNNAAKLIREERNRRLAETDWRITYEVEKASNDGLGLFVPVVWTTYRQALRDITIQPGFPHNVTWPTKPT